MNFLSTRVDYTLELVSSNLRSNVELCAYDTKVIDNVWINVVTKIYVYNENMWYTIYFPIGQLSFDLYQLWVLVLVKRSDVCLIIDSIVISGQWLLIK